MTPSSQAKGTKSTSFLTHKERSGLSVLGYDLKIGKLKKREKRTNSNGLRWK